MIKSSARSFDFLRNVLTCSASYLKKASQLGTEEYREVLQQAAELMKQHPSIKVRLEGHCDARGTQEYNLALGERRALAVKTALQDRGITENRIATLSYGEEKPAVLGNTAEAWSRNRRADFVPVLLNAK